MIKSGLTGQNTSATPPETGLPALLQPSVAERIMNIVLILFLVVLGLGLGAFTGLFISLYSGWIRIYC